MKKIALFGVILLMLAPLLPALAFEYPEGTLHRGIHGHREEIEFLQYQLFYAGYLGDDISEVDGVFGKKTESAVKEYQLDHELEVTGIVDPYTKMLLDEEWTAAMEPQGSVDPHGLCYVEHHANGATSIVLCERHKSRYSECSAMIDAAQDDAQHTQALQAGINAWLEDVNSLYGEWTTFEPSCAEEIAKVQTTFVDHYQANLALWNRMYPSPSTFALEKAYAMVSDHCVALCCSLDATY